MAFLSVTQELALGWVQSADAKRLLVVSCPCCDTLMPNIEDANTRCHVCSWKPGELVSDCRPQKPQPEPLLEPTAERRKLVKCPCGAERSDERDLGALFLTGAELDRTLETKTTELRACRRCGSLYIPRPVSSSPA
jgi:hypothetical protein